MNEKVTQLPLPPGQLYSFRMGRRVYILVIAAMRPGLRHKRAEVIPISTISSEADQPIGAGASLNLHSAPAGVMNVSTTKSGRRSNMKTFAIDGENQVKALEFRAEGEPNAGPGAARFSSIDELAQKTREWPLARLVAVWNGLPGLTRLTRFTDRKTAVTRIWKALQDAAESTQASHTASAKRRGGRSKKALARAGTKKARILNLLKQPKGATVRELMRATGWQSHSVRGFISGHLVKRMELQVNSTRRSDGQRLYRIMRG